MNDDIVKRLREMTGPVKPNLIDDAADEIERLRELLQNAYESAKTLTADRDEARRLYCERMSPGDPPRHAERWRWDCYGAFEDREQLKAELREAVEERDEARRAYCLETGIWVGDEDEPRRLTAAELARDKGWPWPIADPKPSDTLDGGGDHAAERLRRGDVG